MVFCEIISAYSENHMKLTITLCGREAELLIVKACGIYNYHWVLELSGDKSLPLVQVVTPCEHVADGTRLKMES
jgi:hypothetical protein